VRLHLRWSSASSAIVLVLGLLHLLYTLSRPQAAPRDPISMCA